MKKVLWILILGIVGWLGYVKWINADFPYPWEYFKTPIEVEETLAWKASDNCFLNSKSKMPSKKSATS